MADTAIIGAGSGIGQAYMHYVMKEGRRVWAGDKGVSGIDGEYHGVHTARVDVRHQDYIKPFLEDWLFAEELLADGTPRKFPGAKHLVYTAGVNFLTWAADADNMDDEEQLNLLDINLMGFIRTMECLAALRRKQLNERLDATKATALHAVEEDVLYRLPDIRVVAIVSDAAHRPLRTSMAYCASKAGLLMAVKVAARELADLNIRVNAVSPGMVAGTGMTNYIDRHVPLIRDWTPREAIAYERSQEVVKGRISVAEVCHVIDSTLLGPDHLNGAEIVLNGGR